MVSLLNKRLKGIPGSKPHERGPRREERCFHGEPVLVPGEEEKGGRVLSREEIDSYALAGEIHLAHPNSRSMLGGRSSGMALRNAVLSPSGFFPL